MFIPIVANSQPTYSWEAILGREWAHGLGLGPAEGAVGSL